MVQPLLHSGPSGTSNSEASWRERRMVSEQILLNHERFKEIWENKVRAQIMEVQNTVSTILVDSFGIFLIELAALLLQEPPCPEKLSESAMAKIHGGNRALFRGYSLTQLLLEFSVAREVLAEELQSQGILTNEIRSLIDKSIDRSLTAAVMEFERIQNANVKMALDKAESSNHDLEQLAFVAAHDLNSPLATISSLMELLAEDIGAGSSPETKEYIVYIQETLLRMRNLIGNLLEYARLTRMKKAFQRTSLNDVVIAAIQNLKDEIEKSQAQVVFKELPSISGDPDLLIQVFQNLIANSIKYRGKDPPKIDINAMEKDPETWLIKVKDNGVGFDEKDKEEIFRLYKRLQNQSEALGAGIGLATCRKVIELHGGKIRAESCPGQGSTFYFTLPKLDSKQCVGAG